jgi:ribosomal protein L35
VIRLDLDQGDGLFLPIPEAEVTFRPEDCATICAQPDRSGPAIERLSPVMKGCRVKCVDAATDDVNPDQPTISIIPDQAFAHHILRRKDVSRIHRITQHENVDRQDAHQISAIQGKPV